MFHVLRIWKLADFLRTALFFISLEFFRQHHSQTPSYLPQISEACKTKQLIISVFVFYKILHSSISLETVINSKRSNDCTIKAKQPSLCYIARMIIFCLIKVRNAFSQCTSQAVEVSAPKISTTVSIENPWSWNKPCKNREVIFCPLTWQTELLPNTILIFSFTEVAVLWISQGKYTQKQILRVIKCFLSVMKSPYM